MISFADFVIHVVNTLEKKGFVFLFKGRNDADIARKIAGDLQLLDLRTAKLFAYVSKAVRAGSDVPPGIASFTNYIVDFQNVRASDAPESAVFQMIGEVFDLNAVHFELSGVKYLACIDCDSLQPTDLSKKAQQFEEVAVSLRSIQGKTKPKVLGMKIGKGIETDVIGSLCFVFSNPESYRRLQPAVDRIELSSTSLGARYMKGMRALVLNPMLFGNKGNVDFDKLVCRLYDRTIKSYSEGRRAALKVMSLGLASYGFDPQELVP